MLVIKKRVSLDFLGDEYKDSYITVRSISVGELDGLKKSKLTVKETVIDRFINGEIKQDDGMVKVTKENIEELPSEVFVEAFELMSGRIDPKLEGPLRTQSSTEQTPQEN